jgi:flap endonuclease-1
MGIKGLSKFIKTYLPNTIKDIHLSELKNKVIAVDTNYYLYKYSMNKDNYLIKFGYQYEHLCSYGIRPLYVFDGKPPKEKQKVIERRKLKSGKKQTDGFYEKIKELKKYFESKEIVYLESISETDFMCSKLSENNLIDGCLTDDMDFLTLGSKHIYREYTQRSDRVIEYNLENILKEFNRNEFIDICIYLGCDYCENIQQYVNKKTEIDIYELFKKYNSLENIWEYLKSSNIINIDIYKEINIKNDWIIARNILLNEEVIYTENDLLGIEFLKNQETFLKIQKKIPKRINKTIDNTKKIIENRFELLTV